MKEFEGLHKCLGLNHAGHFDGFTDCVACAADLPPVPDHPIAAKKELLFADDFEGAERPAVGRRRAAESVRGAVARDAFAPRRHPKAFPQKMRRFQ